MLKITRLSAPTDAVTRLRVDGRIVLRTACELAKACHAALAEGPPVLVDLGGVVFVDREGAAALAALERRGATIVGCSPFVGALLRAHADGASEGDSADDGLVARLRAGDPDAFGDIVRRHAHRAWAVAHRLLARDDEAYAVVTEAFYAMRDGASLPTDAPLATTIVRTVTTAALARLGNATPASGATTLDPLRPRFDDDGNWATTVAPLALPAEPEAIQALVRRRIDELPDPHRRALFLRIVGAFAIEDAATHLDLPPSTLRTQLHEAHQALRTLLTQPGC